jgi:hypothetical protein
MTAVRRSRVRTFVVMASLLALTLPAGARQSTGPNWARPDRFWYRRAVQGGNYWLNVDLVNGVRTTLFDHGRLAIEINLRTGRDYTPLTLPFADPATEFTVKYDGTNDHTQTALALEFVLDGQQWRCDLEVEWDWGKVPPTDYECTDRGPVEPDRRPQPSAPQPVPSPDGRWEAFVQNDNVAIRPRPPNAGAPKALSSDGTAIQAYQPGTLSWSDDSATLTAYRVSEQAWQSDSLSGSVKTLISKGQWQIK